MRRKLICAAAAFCLVISPIAACSGDDDDGPSRSTTTTEQVAPTTTQRASGTTSSTSGPGTTDTTKGGQTVTTGRQTTATPTPDQCDESSSWNTKPDSKQITSTASQTLGYLSQARVGRHDCYDRVVFDFQGATGGANARGFDVRYVDVVRQDGSGEPVPVKGSAALQVVVYGDQPPAPIDLSGSVNHVVDWSALKEVRSAGYFEGNYTIAVGVAERAPFRAEATASGGVTKVFVDIAHG